MNATLFLPLVQRFREFSTQYGPFSPISKEDAKELDPNLVWTLTEDGSELGNTVLVNGFQESDVVFLYLVSTVPWSGVANSIQMIEVIWFDCHVCGAGSISDPDNCAECHGNGCLSIDIEELAVKGPVEITESDIWNARRPG